MAVTISNEGARSFWMQNGTISHNNWSEGSQHQIGYYNANTSYAMQLRFRLDKPCSSIKIQAMESSGSDYIYWKVSDKEEDIELLNRIFTVGNEPDATRAGSWETFEIEGNFPANKDLYVYVFNYATYYNIVKLFGLYDNTRYTKVIDATEMEGAVYIGDGVEFVSYQVYIGNDSSFDLYIPYIGDGTNWIRYNG